MKQKENNMKWRHYMWAIFGGMIFTVLAVIIFASLREHQFAKNGGEWRWKDWWSLVANGMIGQVLQLGLIYLMVTYN